MFEQISIRVAALMIYAVVITILWIYQGARGMMRENKNILRLHARDTQINKLLQWQGEAMAVLDSNAAALKDTIGLFDKLEEAEQRSRDLAKLNADLAALVMVFKSRFPRSYEIVVEDVKPMVRVNSESLPGCATASAVTPGGARVTA